MAILDKPILKLDSRAWHDQVAQLVACEDFLRVPAVLVETLRQVVPFDYSVMFAYRAQDRPICPYDMFTAEQRIIYVTDYLEGPYLLDPLYQACVDHITPGLYRLRDVAPDRFYHSEYYRSYYRRTGLAEEIGFLVGLPLGMMMVISLMRAGSGTPFSERDMGKLRRVEPLVHASTAKLWRLITHLRPDPDEDKAVDPPMDLQVSSAFKKFGEGVLTRREREVVRMVLRGHSSESIGRRFGITTGTVKIHRKNIYAKLGISSQSELFSHFISYLSHDMQPDASVSAGP